MPDVYEEVMGVVSVTTLGPHNYCVILDPVGPDGKNQLGQKLVFKVSACPSPRGEWPEALDPCPFPPPTPGRHSRNIKLVSAPSVHTCLSLENTVSLIFLAIPDLRLPTVSPGSASLTLVNADPETLSHISCLSLLEALSSCVRQISWFTLLCILCLSPSLNYVGLPELGWPLL